MEEAISDARCQKREENFTPFSSDQMIRNLSMKIGEVDSGSARLLAAHLVAAERG